MLKRLPVKPHIKKMLVQSKTNFLPIKKDGFYKPNTPLFIFFNDGNTIIYINDRAFFPGETFGLDNSMFVALGAIHGIDITVQEITDFFLRFDNAITDDVLNVGEIVKSCVLITTEYNISKQF